MKSFTALALTLALSVSATAFAQSGGKDMSHGSMSNHDMKDMPMDSKSHANMKGMDMKDNGQAKKDETHSATATVKSADPAKGTVTLAHEPVKSLKWPAMTMGFSVKDKSLFDKLNAGDKVQIEFVKQGSQYVVTSVK